jgi:hypothetical protein
MLSSKERVVDNSISEIRRKIRALRTEMFNAERLMRGQIQRDEDCSVTGERILKMRAAMQLLAHERVALGDRDLIYIHDVIAPPTSAPKPPPVYAHSVKRHLIPRTKACLTR